MILIVGASGYMGYNLFQRFKNEGREVLGTYCNSKKEGLIHFDLNLGQVKNIIEPQKMRYVIITAVANVETDKTKKNWEYSYQTNVIQVKEVVRFCFENDLIPIYISSDNVFDGQKGNYKEDDQTTPINCYGKIKQEVENFILASGKPYVILRMGKIFGVKKKDGTVLTSTLESLLGDEKVSWIDDQFFTPIYLEDLCNFVNRVIDENYLGIFHLASLKKTTRYEIAKAINTFFNLNYQISSCTVNSLNLLDKRPRLIDLNIDKYKKLTGYEEKNIDYYLELINKKGSFFPLFSHYLSSH